MELNDELQSENINKSEVESCARGVLRLEQAVEDTPLCYYLVFSPVKCSGHTTAPTSQPRAHDLLQPFQYYI